MKYRNIIIFLFLCPLNFGQSSLQIQNPKGSIGIYGIGYKNKSYSRSLYLGLIFKNYCREKNYGICISSNFMQFDVYNSFGGFLSQYSMDIGYFYSLQISRLEISPSVGIGYLRGSLTNHNGLTLFNQIGSKGNLELNFNFSKKISTGITFGALFGYGPTKMFTNGEEKPTEYLFGLMYNIGLSLKYNLYSYE